jgi:hypothetical protein
MPRNNRRTFWKEFWEQGEIAIMLIGIVLLIYFVYMFMANWHNLDIIHNMNFIINRINEAGFQDENGSILYIPQSAITDTASDYVERPLNDYYISSNNSILKYFLYSLVDMLILSFLLGKRLNSK